MFTSMSGTNIFPMCVDRKKIYDIAVKRICSSLFRADTDTPMKRKQQNYEKRFIDEIWKFQVSGDKCY